MVLGIKLFFLSVAFFLLWSGCSLSSEKRDIPQMDSLNYNKKDYYISDGEGESKKEAINVALELVASRISSNVGSKFNMRKKNTLLNYDKTIEQEITVEVKKIDFSYTLIDSWHKNGKHHVKLKIDRKKFATYYANNLYRTLGKLEDELRHLSTLRKYFLLNKFPFNTLYSKLDTIITVHQNHKDIDYFEKKIKVLERKKYSYSEEVSFRVKSNNSQIENMITDVLNHENFNVSSNGKIELIVNLGEIEIEEIYKEYYGASSATVKIVNQQEIITKVLQLSTNPSFTRESVRANIIQDLRKKFPIFLKKELK